MKKKRKKLLFGGIQRSNKQNGTLILIKKVKEGEREEREGERGVLGVSFMHIDTYIYTPSHITHYKTHFLFIFLQEN